MFDYFGRPVELQYREYRYSPEFPCIFFLLGEYRFRPSTSELEFLHFHNLMEIGICHGGLHELYLEDRKVSFTEGDIYIIPAYAMHNTADHDPSPSHSCEYIYFSPEEIIRSMLPPGDNGPTPPALYEQPDLPTVFSRAYDPELYDTVLLLLKELHEKKENWKTAVRGLAVHFFSRAARISSKAEFSSPLPDYRARALLHPALEYISSHYEETILSDTLAELCGLPSGRFQKLFRTSMKRSVSSYLHLIRIEKACDRLTSTEDPILAIALDTGFSSIITFNRHFRRICGMTPRQWRNTRRRIRKKNISHTTFSSDIPK